MIAVLLAVVGLSFGAGSMARASHLEQPPPQTPAPSEQASGSGVITTVAGTVGMGLGGYRHVSPHMRDLQIQRFGFSGDGGPSNKAQLHKPTGVAVSPHGELFIADSANHRVRRVSNGIITTIAGTGDPGFRGDGGKAVAAALSSPQALAVGWDGSVYISDSGNRRIRKIDTNGVISTVVGTGEREAGGWWFWPNDNSKGYGQKIALSEPSGLSVTATGELLIVDRLHHRILSLDRKGMITTVAGTGEGGFSNNGTATQSMLRTPHDVAALPGGGFLIADYENNRIREVSSSGQIRTVAGSGESGDSGNFGPAREAQLSHPVAVAVLPNGHGFLISDKWNQQIRRVSSRGEITTVVGDRTAGFAGDGVPPQEARLRDPHSLAVTPDGSFYIADTHNHRIRLVSGVRWD